MEKEQHTVACQALLLYTHLKGSSLGTQPCPSSRLLTDMHTLTHTHAYKVLTVAPWDNRVAVFSYRCDCGCVVCVFIICSHAHPSSLQFWDKPLKEVSMLS